MGERFVLEIEALEDPVPAAVRLKQWLKLGLRGLRLKCHVVGPGEGGTVDRMEPTEEQRQEQTGDPDVF